MITLKPILLSFDGGVTLFLELAVRLKLAYLDKMGGMVEHFNAEKSEKEKEADCRKRYPIIFDDAFYRKLNRKPNLTDEQYTSIENAMRDINAAIRNARRISDCITTRSIEARITLADALSKAVECVDTSVYVYILGSKRLSDAERARLVQYLDILDSVKGLTVLVDGQLSKFFRGDA